MSCRVVHIGTGLTGTQALRGVIDDPALELVGLLVHTPDKAGVDAGALCGAADTGVVATADRDAVMAAEPHCVLYCATAVRREDAVLTDICEFLAAGVDVVTISTIPMVYPAAAPAPWRERIEKACAAGSSTFYATGAEPGFISLNIPTALLSGCGIVRSFRLDEYALDLDHTYPIWDVLHESMGFGKPDGHVPVRIASGKVEHDWRTVVLYLAEILGVTLDRVELDWETLLAPTDLVTECGTIASGTICGHRWQLSGVVAGRAVVGVQYFASVTSTPWPAHWPRPAQEGRGGMVFRVDGDPDIELAVHFGEPGVGGVNPGVVATACAAVNAIPAVSAAPPGVVSVPLSGPSVVSRRTITHS